MFRKINSNRLHIYRMSFKNFKNKSYILTKKMNNYHQYNKIIYQNKITIIRLKFKLEMLKNCCNVQTVYLEKKIIIDLNYLYSKILFIIYIFY